MADLMCGAVRIATLQLESQPGSTAKLINSIAVQPASTLIDPCRSCAASVDRPTLGFAVITKPTRGIHTDARRRGAHCVRDAEMMYAALSMIGQCVRIRGPMA